MSVGSWDPAVGAASPLLTPDPATLAALVDQGRGDLEELENRLPPAEQQRLAGLMRIDHEVWEGAVEALSDAEIESLIRFFAVAENLPGWQAGAASPVIPLARTLRRRGRRLDRAFLLWLREVNDNRFLPYGPL